MWHVVDDGAYSISVTGERQSPINICTKTGVETCDELGELACSYVAKNCTTVENTGSSWKVSVTSDGSCNDQSSIQEHTSYGTFCKPKRGSYNRSSSK
jgi:carbonic anhydrase